MSELAKNKERDITFDIMKGIGILLVLLGHVWPPLPFIHKVAASFHMPMFFIVAGYFSKSFSEVLSLGDTIQHYAKRLLLPYLVTMVAICLWILLKACLGVVSWDEVLTRIVSILWADVNSLHLPFGKTGIGVVWFLFALFWTKVLLLIITKWEKWVLPISVVISLGALLLHKVFPYSIWCISIACVCLPFVAFGWWIRRHNLPWYIWGCLVIGWGLALLFSNLDLYTYTLNCYPIDVLGGIGGSFVLYLLSKCVVKIQGTLVLKCLQYLGGISLAIMCVHDFEIASHLGNHLRAAIGWDMPIWGLYVWRYALTIALAIVLTKIPKVKSLFV